MRAPLATFQYIVMRAIQRLGNEAYGMAIEDYITNELPELALTVDLAQIYITTKRLLEPPGYLTVREAPAPGGSGHTVKIYRVSEEGARVLDQAAAFFAAVAKLEGENPYAKTSASPRTQQNKHTRTRPRAR